MTSMTNRVRELPVCRYAYYSVLPRTYGWWSARHAGMSNRVYDLCD